MKLLSSIVKSSHVILDNKRFVLSTKITTPEIVADATAKTEPEHLKKQRAEELIASAIDEARVIVEQAMEEAQHHVQLSKFEAEKIISDGMDQAIGAKAKAKLEGFREGQMEGFDEGRQVSQALVNDALVVKEEAITKYRQMIDNSESDVMHLVIDICTKILNQKMTQDDYIVGLIRMALDKCTYTTNVVLRVSEEDYDYVLMEKDRILVLCESVDDIEVKMDRSLNRGACVVESPSGSIDASIQVQLDYIKQRIEDLLISE
jgi:flagellar assembly protein FliH